MKSFCLFTALLFLVVVASHCSAQTGSTKNGFHGLLEIVDIGPDDLTNISANEPTEANWTTISQIVSRLKQHRNELPSWILTDQDYAPESVGELFEVSGTVETIEPLPLPSKLTEQSDIKTLFRCRLKLSDNNSINLLTTRVPKRWNLTESLAEPVSFQGVLLHNGEVPLFLTTHLAWFPTSGLPDGKLLLARFGMDASLWDDVVQGSSFVSPEQGREAQAFYTCLAILQKIPASELARETLASIARQVALSKSPDSKHSVALTTAINKQADLGLSSVAPLFLEPRQVVGELVRLEGTARRAVRISVSDEEQLAVGQPISEYYELEVFTPDSQNLPVVCCVTQLPADFPTGDAIRAGVRFDGVFFKGWRYRSRKVVEGPGETETQQQRYTPIILAASVTWLKQPSAQPSLWGLVVGVCLFAAMIFGLARMFVSQRRASPTRLPDKLPDFQDQ